MLIGLDIVGEGATAVIYDKGTGRVLKLVRDAAINEWIHLEYHAMRAAWRVGLPLPEPFELVEIDGRKGIVMERICGRSFPEGLFNRDDRFQSVRDLARLIHRINAAPLTAGETAPMRRLKDSLAWLIGINDALTDGEREAALKLAAALPDGGCLCHGDTHPYNVIVRDGGLVMIDWGAVSIGCPVYDAVYLSLVWRYAELPPGMPEAFVDQFTRHRMEIDGVFLQEYKRLSGCTDADLALWLVPVAAGKGTLVASPGERQTLLNVVRRGLK